VDLLEELVGLDSVNPAMGGPGEEAIARWVAKFLEGLGADVSLLEVDEGRPNVLATLPKRSEDPAILLTAHLDTVALPQGGLRVERTPERVIGRGACDTKGSLAAMLGAVAELAADRPDGPGVLFAGTVDEEAAMRGSRALVEHLSSVYGAVVGEPTSLVPVRAHNGMVRFTVTAHGRSAHTSRADLGVNAVVAAARAVVALEDHLGPVLRGRARPLTGPALLTPAVITGGVAPNVVPDRCTVVVDRRLAPGETVEGALAEVDEALRAVDGGRHRIVRDPPFLTLPPLELPPHHPLVLAAEEAVETVTGHRVVATGAPYGTDASNLWGLGRIPCVVLGPGSVEWAHTDEEWVSLDEVRQATAVYVELVRRLGHHQAGSPRRNGGS
jgi:acetylornithine deacetylase